MEKRAILAAVLMAALLIVYQTFFVPQTPEAPRAPETPKTATPRADSGQPPSAAKPAQGAATAAKGETAARIPAPRPPERRARVEGPLYDAVVSSDGGRLEEWTLKYRGHKPVVVPGELGPGGLLISRDPTAPAEPVAMTLSSDTVKLPREGGQNLVLAGELDGLKIDETLQFQGDRYGVRAGIRIENRSDRSRAIVVSLPWTLREPWKDPAEKFAGQKPSEVVWSAEGRIDRQANLAALGDRTLDGHWIGFDSVWYLSALVPDGAGFKLFTATEGKIDPTGKAGSGRVTIGVRAAPTIEAGQTWEGTVLLYAGPKEYERLRAVGLEGTINFGGFPVPQRYGGLPMEWLGIPILLLLKWVERFVGNYGVAIILLTILSKLLFYPLTVKSMRSMKAMQALQPQVNSLRSKYKDDPQRLQRETLELYRKYKVNPMGGCLPMVAQIPIFYALYLALSVSVELQNAPFICFGRFFGMDLWICDLASHDPTYVLPILMGISMFMQQKMTPTMGDPRQAKMMLVMPFVFTFMFLNLPSGLVLYWFVSNVLQVAQQWYMDRARRVPSEAIREGKHASKA